MSKSITIPAMALAAMLLSFRGGNAQCQALYEDTSAFLGGNFNFGNAEVGNQITLAGTAGSYFVSGFVFQFDFTSVGGIGSPTGNEMGDVRFYRNDGPPSNAGDLSAGAPPNVPGTLIFDSGEFLIGGFTFDSLATFSNPAQLGALVVVPPTFTWTVAFSGLDVDQTAGLALYSPATVGTNYGGAWLNGGAAWQWVGASAGNPPPVFGAIVNGIPVPELRFSAKSNFLVLSWPAYTGFSLQSTTNLSNSANWVPVSGSVVIDKQIMVTNVISGPAKFYRLALPVSF